MVSNDSLYSEHGIDSLTKSLACSEAGLLLGVIQNLMPKDRIGYYRQPIYLHTIYQHSNYGHFQFIDT